MSNSLSGVKAFTKAVIDLKPWTRDPAVIRKDWDEDAYRLKDHGRGEDLCFAIMWDNGCTLPHPPIRRAMEETKQALVASGFKGAILHSLPDPKPRVIMVYSFRFSVIDWPSFNYGELCTSLVRFPVYLLALWKKFTDLLVFVIAKNVGRRRIRRLHRLGGKVRRTSAEDAGTRGCIRGL